MLRNKDLMVGNNIASGVKYSDTSIIGEVLSIGNDEQEFEQIYTECEESFEWFFKDNYCGIPLSKEWFDKLSFKEYIGIQISYSYVLIDYNSYDDIIHRTMYHYKEISISKNEIDTWYVFIREGYSNDRTEDEIIMFSNNYKYVHQVQQLLKCAKF